MTEKEALQLEIIDSLKKEVVLLNKMLEAKSQVHKLIEQQLKISLFHIETLTEHMEFQRFTVGKLINTLPKHK